MEPKLTIREYGEKGRAIIQQKRANGQDFRDFGQFDDIDAATYLAKREMEYVRNIEELAETGTKEDLVKLKANQILLNKILPDKTRHEVGLDNTSPMTILLAAIQQNQALAKPPELIPIESKPSLPISSVVGDEK